MYKEAVLFISAKNPDSNLNVQQWQPQELLISVETLLCARPSIYIISFDSHNSHVR